MGISKEKHRTKLSTSEQLKLSKSTQEEGSDKLSFFETDGKIGSDFKVFYDLHSQIESISNSLVFFDMNNVFKIVPTGTVDTLQAKLEVLFSCQRLYK